jgi:hypothetical protein
VAYWPGVLGVGTAGSPSRCSHALWALSNASRSTEDGGIFKVIPSVSRQLASSRRRASLGPFSMAARCSSVRGGSGVPSFGTGASDGGVDAGGDAGGSFTEARAGAFALVCFAEAGVRGARASITRGAAARLRMARRRLGEGLFEDVSVGMVVTLSLFVVSDLRAMVGV